MFRYEQLPDFCYVCGKLDHQEYNCDVVVRLNEGKKAHKEYGAWLRAEGPAFNISNEGVADSRSVEGSFSSLPMRQKGEQKSLPKENKASSLEKNIEIRRKGSDKGV